MDIEKARLEALHIWVKTWGGLPLGHEQWSSVEAIARFIIDGRNPSAKDAGDDSRADGEPV